MPLSSFSTIMSNFYDISGRAPHVNDNRVKSTYKACIYAPFYPRINYSAWFSAYSCLKGPTIGSL